MHLPRYSTFETLDVIEQVAVSIIWKWTVVELISVLDVITIFLSKSFAQQFKAFPRLNANKGNTETSHFFNNKASTPCGSVNAFVRNPPNWVVKYFQLIYALITCFHLQVLEPASTFLKLCWNLKHTAHWCHPFFVSRT